MRIHCERTSAAAGKVQLRLYLRYESFDLKPLVVLAHRTLVIMFVESDGGRV
jgi:hypothetical protein